MSTSTNFMSGSMFKVRSPFITNNGTESDTDSDVLALLEELDKLLSKRVFSVSDASAVKKTPQEITIDVLKKPIIPKRTISDKWANEGILNDLNSAVEVSEKLTLEDYIDKTEDLSTIKNNLLDLISSKRSYLDYDIKTVIGFRFKGILDYLISVAFFERKIKDATGMFNFITKSKKGAKVIINYAIVSAARKIIQTEKIEMKEGYNDETDPIIIKIVESGLSLSSSTFRKKLDNIFDNYKYNSAELELIIGSSIKNIPPEFIPILIRYMKNSPVKIDKSNIDYFLPLFISQAKRFTPSINGTVDEELEDKDFEVEFFEDDKSMIKISVSNVNCAAQLFYSLVLGDELQVFDAVNYLTHKFMVKGGIEIQNPQLRENLQLYVFSNKFTDKNGKITDRTERSERHLFYKQVFDYGKSKMIDEMLNNKEFKSLWKVLVFESAKYLERAQSSENPESYVSRQNVVQAVEDLQYNLSSYCTGMANVITPIIYNELTFVIKKILGDEEIIRQIVPSGGSWWRVVEALIFNMKSVKPKTTTFYNKAKYGYYIIKSIADYTPGAFEDDTKFSDFIGAVDAFIITQSQLQETTDEVTDDSEEEEYNKAEVNPSMNDNAPASKNGNDEWDF